MQAGVRRACVCAACVRVKYTGALTCCALRAPKGMCDCCPSTCRAERLGKVRRRCGAPQIAVGCPSIHTYAHDYDSSRSRSCAACPTSYVVRDYLGKKTLNQLRSPSKLTLRQRCPFVTSAAVHGENARDNYTDHAVFRSVASTALLPSNSLESNVPPVRTSNVAGGLATYAAGNWPLSGAKCATLDG